MSNNVVCMIPARMGSKRVKNKNTRLLGGIPLISHVIRKAKDSDCFDEIYVNSESDSIQEIAEAEGVKFYKRPERLSSDEATNDAFMSDFLWSVDCGHVVQLLPTSPFISDREIKDFVWKMVKEGIDTLISVKKVQIECVYQGKPINFDQREPTPPSQELEPIKAYACSLMGWDRINFLTNMNTYGCAYHGGSGKIDYFDLEGLSEIDIDEEKDFKLAESVWRSLND